MSTVLPERLEVVKAADDRARRRGVAITLGIGGAAGLFSYSQPEILGIRGGVLAAGIFIGLFVLLIFEGLPDRAVALLRVGRIRQLGLASTARLNQGDFEGAREGFAMLLELARPLGAFHAVHVLMYGVVRFFQGDAKEGLTLASRAIDSGWLHRRPQRQVLEAAESWRVLMLIALGDLDGARSRVATFRPEALPTARLAFAAAESRWQDVIDGASASLADPNLPKEARPTIACLGAHAARQSKASPEAFDAVLSKEPLTGLALANPALKPFLPPGSPSAFSIVVPGIVVGRLNDDTLQVVLHPGSGQADGGRPHDIPLRLVPVSLRTPNTELEVVFDSAQREVLEVRQKSTPVEGNGIASDKRSVEPP